MRLLYAESAHGGSCRNVCLVRSAGDPFDGGPQHASLVHV